MAKDFNIYQWRRNFLNEGNQNPSLKAAMEEWFGSSTPTREEMINFVEWFYNQDASEPSMMGLNEELERSKLYPKNTLLQFEKVWLPKSLGIEGGTGKESYIALYTKDQVQANLDKIPDQLFHTIMNFGAPIFLRDPSQNKPQSMAPSDDYISAQYAADKAAGIRPGLD